jgi:hypothetical protein
MRKVIFITRFNHLDTSPGVHARYISNRRFLILP